MKPVLDGALVKTIAVNDAVGNNVQLTVQYTHDGGANSPWKVSVTSSPPDVIKELPIDHVELGRVNRLTFCSGDKSILFQHPNLLTVPQILPQWGHTSATNKIDASGINLKTPTLGDIGLEKTTREIQVYDQNGVRTDLQFQFKVVANGAGAEWRMSVIPANALNPPITNMDPMTVNKIGLSSDAAWEIDLQQPTISNAETVFVEPTHESNGPTSHASVYGYLIEPADGTLAYKFSQGFEAHDNSSNIHYLNAEYSKEAGNNPWKIKITPASALDGGVIEVTIPPDLTSLKLADGREVEFGGLRIESNKIDPRVTVGMTNILPPQVIDGVIGGAKESPTYDTSVQVYDSQGNMHNIEVTFKKTGQDNVWEASVLLPDGTRSGPERITFDASGQFVSGSMNVTFNPRNGAEDLIIAIDFSQVTQYATETTIVGYADGYDSGLLETISVDSSGIITGLFSNGQMMALCQLCLATFTNPAGLNSLGGNLFALSNNSGDPDIGRAGIGGRGSIRSSSLEMSNVNLADEFTDMIVTQRGFQANSKIITTTDTMLEELINLKRQ